MNQKKKKCYTFLLFSYIHIHKKTLKHIAVNYVFWYLPAFHVGTVTKLNIQTFDVKNFIFYLKLLVSNVYEAR
jgi:hypothetical protein